MRTGSAPLPVLLALCALAVVPLSGCAASPVRTPAPTKTTDAAAPLFATDEEALAAAEEAYAAYLAASDEVLAGGGVSTEALETIAIGQALDFEKAGAADFAAGGLHAIGATNFTTHRLQSVQPGAEWAVEVRLYVCDDLSAVDLLDASGESKALPDRAVHIPFLIAIVGDAASTLKVSEKELWVEGNFC